MYINAIQAGNNQIKERERRESRECGHSCARASCYSLHLVRNTRATAAASVTGNQHTVKLTGCLLLPSRRAGEG